MEQARREQSSTKETHEEVDSTQKLGEQAVKDTKRREKLDGDVDSILDEIDDVLEENAEEFVQSFRQKGGQ